MQPIKRTYAATGTYIIPLNTYGRVGFSYYATKSVTVKPLADKDLATSIIDSITAGTGGVWAYPADAVAVVVASTNTDVIISQYGS